MSKASVLLRGTNLHKNYHIGGEDLRVLRGVDLSVARGEWVAIVGASGSGKSTLLHLLGGLDRPNQGTVQFDGRDMFSAKGRAIDHYRNQQIGFVFQFYHLLPELSALENVLIAAMIGRGVYRWLTTRLTQRQRATELLDRLGLSHRLRHRPNKLSGGERQRVALARALINQPAVLLADEPTGNLDAAAGQQILDVLGSLNENGQTIVMVTHDPHVAAGAQRRARLEAGRLVHAG